MKSWTLCSTEKSSTARENERYMCTSCIRTMLEWFRSFIVLISLCTWKLFDRIHQQPFSVSHWMRSTTCPSWITNWQEEFGNLAWFMRLVSMTICLSRILTATYFPFVLSRASFTFAKVPSPIVRPSWYLPTLLANPIFPNWQISLLMLLRTAGSSFQRYRQYNYICCRCFLLYAGWYKSCLDMKNIRSDLGSSLCLFVTAMLMVFLANMLLRVALSWRIVEI